MNKVGYEADELTGADVMFVTLVGEENIEFVIRSVHAGYIDESYRYPMPMVAAIASDRRKLVESDIEFVVDTGADITLLQARVADQLNLWTHPFGTVSIRGIGADPELRALYRLFVRIAEKQVTIASDCREDLTENVLGRDVINEFRVSICAKEVQVTFESVD